MYIRLLYKAAAIMKCGECRKNVLFDLGLYLVAIFYRCGVSDDLTPKQLWEGGDEHQRDMFITCNIDKAITNRALLFKPKKGSGLGFKAEERNRSQRRTIYKYRLI